MKKIIEVNFVIKCSNKITQIGYQAGNIININSQLEIENPFKIDNTIFQIELVDKSIYKLKINTLKPFTESEIIQLIKEFSQYITFLINKKEHSPHYGTSFIEIDWPNLIIKENHDNYSQNEHEITFSDTITVSDSISISCKRNVEIDANEIINAHYFEILNFYYDAIKAENIKSKYFHLFLIIEYLEESNLYKNMFNSNKLFDNNEQKIITQLSNQFEDDIKKGTIRNLLNRTKESRVIKLMNLLKKIGLENYVFFGKEVQLEEKNIKNIIEERHKLFHRGQNISENILWMHLYPLVTKIVQIIANNTNCLDIKE